MRALLVVDIQNDFMPGGALGVKNGDALIPLINDLMDKFSLVVASQDWHPYDHMSFAKNHCKEVGEIVEINGDKQILWPVHCVEHTCGSELAPGLDVEKIDKIFIKGTDKWIDSYSAFFDNQRKKSTGLSEYFLKQRVKEVYLVGLTTEYCVRNSAIDAHDLGLEVYVIADACRPVNLSPNDESDAFEEMRNRGINIITSDKIMN